MSKNNNCYILVDRSQSMVTSWDETIGSINGYVEGIKKSVDNVYVAVFDTVSYDIVRNGPVAQWEPISNKEVTPRGGTPLLDAAGRLLYNVLDSGAERAVVVIITDGHENSSKIFKPSHIESITGEIKKKGYEIVFLGNDFSGIKEQAATFGINDPSKWAVRSSGLYDVTSAALMTNTAAYFATGQNMVFTDDVKAASVKKK